ncbi:38K [Dikerogammarus haemobaphes nudivirus]|nr:38K [Dikerogammarus haemobaphes nudivirus]
MIKSAFFVSFGKVLKKKQLKIIIKELLKLAEYIYIIKNEQLDLLITQVCEFEKIPCLSIKSNNVEKDSENTVYIIEKITPRLHVYSMRIAFDIEEIENFEIEKSYNIHVDYTSIIINLKCIEEKLKQIDVLKQQFINRVVPFNYKKSVVVFDLDDTIIDKDGSLLFKNVAGIFNELRQVFDFIVLWSHGSFSHVNNALLLTLADVKFDTVIALDKNSFMMNEKFSRNKGLGKVLRILNNEHGVGEFTLTTLVDDQAGNFIGDYDIFLHIPNSINNGDYVLDIPNKMNNVNRGKQIVLMLKNLKDFVLKDKLKHKSIKSSRDFISLNDNLNDKY